MCSLSALVLPRSSIRRTALALAAGAFFLLPFGKAATEEPRREPAELVVYAAASLREALVAIAPDFEKRTHTKLVFNFGSSGDLARQIVAAGKADVFLSAGEKEIDQVAAEKLVEDGTRRVLLSNQLVVIEPFDPAHPSRSAFREPFTVEQLAGRTIVRLSLANTESVPAGRYARAWLEKRGQWSAVEDRVLPGVDVRAALAAVESGGAQAGIVYRTDAATSKQVRIVHAVPVEEGPKILYSGVAIRARPELARARAFLEHLATRESAQAFERFGFVLPAPAPAEKAPGKS